MKNIALASNPARTRRRAHVAGFTLIEMLISITVGLGILAGLVGVLASNASNSRSNDKTAELLGNGRYALNSLKHEMREAGFRGYSYSEPDTIAAGSLGAFTNECLEGANLGGTFITNLRQGVWGSDNANPFAANCIAAARYLAGNDVLVVRRLAPFPATALAANTVYFQSTYERGQVFRGTTAPVFGGTPAPLANFALQVYVYYVSPFTVAATEVPLVPSLRRVSLNAAGAMVDELVAGGIEHFQVQFGYVENSQTQYVDPSDARLLTADSSNAALPVWDDVNAVRIWLVARNSTVEPGYVNTNTYRMAGQDFVKNDGFRRQMFSTVIQLRN